jgi:bifunctional UDP-N-acetylglucosamine pyrophosphorylase/glucosamine-1-phosphate N-acetyltransferase
VVGDNVFIGSNASLVAPVTIGNGAYTASGSVITEDVPADAVAFGRARQENKPGYAPKLREKALAKKAAKQAQKGKA